MDTKTHACIVIPVTFRPYAETGEFACFGVIVYCKETGFFDFKLGHASDRVGGRIRGFFKELDPKLVREAIRCAHQDIGRVAGAFGTPDLFLDGDRALKQLILPREDIIRYAPPFAILTPDPKAEVQKQYERIVMRGFVDREGYYILKMQQRVRNYLQAGGIKFTKDAPFSFPNGYAFTMPFKVGEETGCKVIKPLNFVMQTAQEIIDHGNKWHYRFMLLHDEKGLDAHRIFVSARLPDASSPLYHAAEDAFGPIRQQVLSVVEDDLAGEERSVLDFIRN